MSLLKQIQHKLYTMILDNTLEMRGSMLPSLARQNSPLVENLGRTLLGLKLLAITLMYTVATFTLSLWLLTKMTLKKLLELFSFTGMPGWNVQYTLCRWADAVKNIPSTFKKWRTSVWKEDGDSLHDSTLAYSEMPGEHKSMYMNKQHEKAMTAPINPKKEVEVDLDLEQRAREAGL